MAKCNQCGMCCTFIVIPLPGITRDNDPLEVAKYAENHSIRTYVGEDGYIKLRIPINCKYLEWDTSTGKTFCLIHGKPERPKICSEFKCEMMEND